ncbi:carboxyl-terminal protease [Filimonas lacunae]|nr:carboxyl-terminal protease [Filimonas lacunae]
MLLLLTGILSCHNKDVASGPVITDSIGKINKWIYDSMQRYYYWSGDITATPDYTLPSGNFFHSLVSNQDRFSYISNQVDVGPQRTTFQLYNFHYSIVAQAATDTMVGVITYVVKGSVAYNSGFRRGTCFSRVNGVGISGSTLATVQAALLSGEVIALTLCSYTDGQWVEGKTVKVGKTNAVENVVVQTRYFSYNGKKTGYLLYNGFSADYDEVLLAAFAKLKNADVTECIIDLRYNPGGSVATCAKLTGMLAPVADNSVFGVFQGNASEGTQVYTMNRVLKTSTNANGNTIAALEANRLSLSRVYVLTTRATISAAELLINNLKPYLPVVQIGDTTLGKDEASIQIVDGRVPRQVQWVIQPIIYKLQNANYKGGYHTGIAPDYAEDELSALPLADFGAASDVLINRALQLIYGTNVVESVGLRKNTLFVQKRFQSAEAAAKVLPVVVLSHLH